MDDARSALPSGWEIIGPEHTPDGWKASARPRHLLKRFLGGAYGMGDTPDEALHNLAEAFRNREDPYDDPVSDEN